MRLPAALLLLLGALAPAAAQQASQAPAGATLSTVRARGALSCGISTGDPAWSQPDSRGEWQGMDADICRAVAAAVLGDAKKLVWQHLTGQNRFPALTTGQVEMLTRTTTWTFMRDSSLGVNFTAPYFYDGQGFLVRANAGITSAKQLDGATICFTSASTHELNLQDWSRSQGIRFTPVIFADKDEARRAYESNRCDSYTGDASQLAAVRAAFPDPAEHVLLADRISKEPYAPAVRQGDDQWFDIVRYVVYGLVEAEELGITQANADQMLAESPSPAVQRLLGKTGGLGASLGLDRAFLLNAIKAVGNYGEVYDRHLGEGSAVKLARGPNALWNRGGIMISPPMR
ncbi:amino acid ABC transporter substrate-binding protein [Siccirubricoccus sp. KC 17139]|uniref:Amino acid ABC transporter substrate-binding protein n=1 Tax=Siccirubricoccus soli TaxID=2899147 RepID=A0ABT1D8B9_9PROT|nr:amino acid ABC transporter substrate-binding protein [Siccirubricoccus soli]MCO6418177.1 amino acid ABC transporter substrate-binding protein [Siccirubricoccus soli]MCP2684312.1 amino acid ABC transporter substrate-binding protein [Siccirubricoccus soli]